MRDVEIDGGLAVEAELFLIDDAVNSARGDVTGNEVAVLGIPFFEEVETFVLRDRFCGTSVFWIPRNPDAAAFAACGFAHQAELVFARNCGRMNLDEFAIGVVHALLEERRLRGAGADHGVGGAAEDGADAASAENH